MFKIIFIQKTVFFRPIFKKIGYTMLWESWIVCKSAHLVLDLFWNLT